MSNTLILSIVLLQKNNVRKQLTEHLGTFSYGFNKKDHHKNN